MKKIGLFIVLLALGQIAISQTLSSLEPSYIGSFSEGLARVKKDGKWGYVDKKGVLVIPTKYDYVSDFNEGMAQVSKMDDVERYYDSGYIDATGVLVIPMQYDWNPNDFHEGLAAVQKGDKWGFVDKHGNSTLK